MDEAKAQGRTGRWRIQRRRFNRWRDRVDLYPRLEVAVAMLVIVLGLASYAVLTGDRAAGFSPPL